MMLSEGQRSDHTGAASMVDALPEAAELPGDKGHDSDDFGETSVKRGIEPRIPSSRSRKVPLPYDAVPYKQRNRIERMFGKLEDWRRVATCYDRCAHTFSAIRIAATGTFRLW